jgi:hypothetical protein
LSFIYFEAQYAVYVVFQLAISKKETVMRFAVRMNIPNEEGNKAIHEGKLGEILSAFVQKWRPEAVYFYLQGGKRGATFFLNLDDASQLPSLSEPFFMGLNAELEMMPAMNFEDLKKGLAVLEKEMKR